jgi:hypothetical protein
MYAATGTLSKGKQRPWSNPQDYLVASHDLGRQAWTALDQVLHSLPPEYRWERYDVPCINGCQSYSDVLWVGDYFCFDCWANAKTNEAIQRAYWRSPDDETFERNVSYDALHAESMNQVAAMRVEQREQFSQTEEQQQWHADLMEKIERRERGE